MAKKKKKPEIILDEEIKPKHKLPERLDTGRKKEGLPKAASKEMPEITDEEMPAKHKVVHRKKEEKVDTDSLTEIIIEEKVRERPLSEKIILKLEVVKDFLFDYRFEIVAALLVIVIGLLIVEVVYSPGEKIIVEVEKTIAGSVCEEHVCSSRDKFHCIETTKVLEDYFCDGNNICTAEFRVYPKNVGCGYVCEDKQCDKEDTFDCNGYTKYFEDYSCNARQECLPESIVDINSPDCNWIDPLAPMPLGKGVLKFDKKVKAYSASATEEYAFIDMAFQPQSETALPGKKFLFIDVEIINTTDLPMKAHLEDFKLYDDRGNFVFREAYRAKDAFPMIYAELQPNSKARGKIRYTINKNQYDFTLAHEFTSRNKTFTAQWEISLPKEDD